MSDTKYTQPDPDVLETNSNYDELDRKLRPKVSDLEPYLLAGERIIKVEQVAAKLPTKTLSVKQALARLTGAYDPHTETYQIENIGLFGPTLAAAVTDDNSDLGDLHLFEALFGRDSLRVAIDVMEWYPRLARATILALSSLQGTKINPRSGEEPGRIIHEHRDPTVDPIAARLTLDFGIEWPYYESIDATPMFISCITEYCRKTGSVALLEDTVMMRDGKERTIAQVLERSVDWLQRRLESNREGLLEYHRTTGMPDSETWKDSYDSFFHADGKLANISRGIAAVEVQALAYDALIDASWVYSLLGKFHQAFELSRRAERLRRQVMRRFWVQDASGGYFAIGLDRSKHGRLRRLAIKTSDMGHLLNSYILMHPDKLTRQRREQIIRQLFTPELLAPAGIRTLASDQPRFRPGAYHNGSVWLWDTHFISRGLHRHGYDGLAYELERRLWWVIDETHKYPEFVRGGQPREELINNRIVEVAGPDGRRNRIEQPPQEIQAWTVAAILASKQHHETEAPETDQPMTAQLSDRKSLEEEILASLPTSA